MGSLDLGHFVFKEELLLAESGLEVVEPGSLGVVLGKEGLVGPLVLTALEELKRHNFLAVDSRGTDDADLSGGGGHGGTTDLKRVSS